MNSEVLSVIFTSGVVSAVVTLLIMTLSIGKYKEKVDRHDRDNEKLKDKLMEVSIKLGTIEDKNIER